jgi:hypothetical protein
MDDVSCTLDRCTWHVIHLEDEMQFGIFPVSDITPGELADLISGLPASAPADPLEGPVGGTPSFEALLRGV